MTNSTKKWIEAAKILAMKPNEKVTCPKCGQAYLIVRDEEVEGWDRTDRHLTCPSCGATNIITLKNGR